MKKIALVVPTIREDCIRRFLQEWKNEFAHHAQELEIFIIEDNPTKTFALTDFQIHHYAWDDIEQELGKQSWIIPRRTDCIRSFGYYKAYATGADLLITLDDDCYPNQPTPYLIDGFLKNFERTTVSTTWFNTLSGRTPNHNELYPRGFPYKNRNMPVVLCHGLWSNVPDFDGQTQIKQPDIRITISGTEASPVPHHAFFPMCGMNVAVSRQVIPAFYFLLMGQNRDGKHWGFDRFGDIWCGIFLKKIIDHLNLACVSGQPVIRHERASNAQKNIELEKAGLEVNEKLYQDVQSITLTKSTFRECYEELAQQIPKISDYFIVLKQAMLIWSELFR